LSTATVGGELQRWRAAHGAHGADVHHPEAHGLREDQGEETLASASPDTCLLTVAKVISRFNISDIIIMYY